MFSLFFKKNFRNTVIIYNSKNRNNDATESQKERQNCFNARVGGE